MNSKVINSTNEAYDYQLITELLKIKLKTELISLDVEYTKYEIRKAF